jgi:uncharacterized membrane protein YphA (DoxX/SURF4 family)
MPREQVGLFILRLSLGVFLLLWSIDKLVAPEGTVRIFQVFYKIPISSSLAYVIGTVEALLSLLIIAGAWKRYTYAIGLALHTVSTLSTWKQLLSPFGQNHLFIAAIPVLAAFLLLYLLRDQDTLWAVEH